ncbi:MAG TPA: hypothetical protein VFC79_13285 [Tissierellaceae bacterium]|nr:hypothetical protein [Tissierellaceae bacterium]
MQLLKSKDMKVKIADKDKDIEYICIALNMCQLNIDYPTAELMLEIIDHVAKVGGEFSLDDGLKITHTWREKWDNYFTKLKENEL